MKVYRSNNVCRNRECQIRIWPLSYLLSTKRDRLRRRARRTRYNRYFIFGRLSPYRSAIIDAIKASGIQNVFANDWLFGNVRDIAVKRAKIVLNLRYWGHGLMYANPNCPGSFI